MRVMSAGVAVSPSTAAAGLVFDSAPSAYVPNEVMRKTVAVVTSIRSTLRAQPDSRRVSATAAPGRGTATTALIGCSDPGRSPDRDPLEALDDGVLRQRRHRRGVREDPRR